MQPNEQKLGIDYLESIAPKEQKKVLPVDLKFILPVAGVLIAVVIGIAFIGSVLEAERVRIRQLDQRLVVKTRNLQTVVTQQRVHVTSGDLRTVNENMNVQLSMINAGLRDFLPQHADESIIMEELSHMQDLTNTFREARLLATFDRVYPQQMSFELATIMALMSQVHQHTNNAALADFLEDAYETLGAIQDQLDRVVGN